MDLTNPYSAPNATLASDVAEPTLADAAAPFVASRGPLRVLSALMGVAALGTAFSAVQPALDTHSYVRYAALITSVSYVASVFVMWRMASAVSVLAKAPSMANIVVTLERLAQTWFIATVVLGVTFVSGLAHRLIFASAIAGGMWEPGVQVPVIAAATRLRRTILVSVGLSAFTLVVSVGSAIVKPPPTTLGATQFLVVTVVSGVVQLGALFLVWRQVPALDAFIARPSSATLRTVGRAHRVIWRVMVWALFATAVIGMVAAIAIPLYVRAHR